MTGSTHRISERDARSAWITMAAAAVAVLVGVIGSHFSVAVFVAAAGALTVIVAYAALTWPRPVLVIVALSPIIDRYLAPGLLDVQVDAVVHFVSEGLLVVTGAALVGQAIYRGRLRAALWHPSVAALAAFVLVAVASAAWNSVPPAQALAGIIFTLDAAVFFVLARVVGFTERQAARAIGAFVALMLVAAAVAALQALLTPNLLGLFALQGRFGEIYRLASFFGDPNVFGALLSAALPFTLFAIRGQPTRTRTILMVAASSLLLLALLHSFSRGGWLGAGIGFGVVALLVDRRALVYGVAIGVAMFLVVSFMPRDLLVGGEHARRPSLIESTADRVGAVNQGRDLRTLFILNAGPILRDHPVLGVGPGMYGGAVADLFGTDVYSHYGTDQLFSNPTQRTVDNFWLHLLVETGLAGFAAFLAAIGIGVWQAMRGLRNASSEGRVLLAGIAAAVIALAVNSVTTMLLESNSVAFVFWLMLGIATVLAAPLVRNTAPTVR